MSSLAGAAERVVLLTSAKAVRRWGFALMPFLMRVESAEADFVRWWRVLEGMMASSGGAFSSRKRKAARGRCGWQHVSYCWHCVLCMRVIDGLGRAATMQHHSGRRALMAVSCSSQGGHGMTLASGGKRVFTFASMVIECKQIASGQVNGDEEWGAVVLCRGLEETCVKVCSKEAQVWGRGKGEDVTGRCKQQVLFVGRGAG
jgi:hypothetical protein